MLKTIDYAIYDLPEDVVKEWGELADEHEDALRRDDEHDAYNAYCNLAEYETWIANNHHPLQKIERPIHPQEITDPMDELPF